jgi:hypothetical protein
VLEVLEHLLLKQVRKILKVIATQSRFIMGYIVKLTCATLLIDNIIVSLVSAESLLSNAGWSLHRLGTLLRSAHPFACDFDWVSSQAKLFDRHPLSWTCDNLLFY